MNILLHRPTIIQQPVINLPGSKSISNRVLIIQAISSLKFNISNLSDSDDTKHLKKAIEDYKKGGLIDVGHAGTDMRFLTAFLAIQHGTFELTGSERLRQRPVKELVEVLKKLGADIRYKSHEGFPPLLINGKELGGGKISIDGTVSSQFITALLLVAPYFTNGLELSIAGQLVSKPYVTMTVELMKEFGAVVEWEDKVISVKPVPYSYSKSDYFIESDWSAASYYYSMVACSGEGTQVRIKHLFKNSLQADSACVRLFERFGVQSHFNEDELTLQKQAKDVDDLVFEYDFTDCPDIAQTLVCACASLNVPFRFTGLQTLKIKETDRIVALQHEFRKFGVELQITENSICYEKGQNLNSENKVLVSTYADHRMAMSFSVLSLILNGLVIEDAEVVSKSYPFFWEHLKQLGFKPEIVQ